MIGLTHEDIDIRFSFQSAAGRRDVAERHEYVREQFRAMAHELLDQLPDGPDKRMALEFLKDAMHRSNAAIAIGFRSTGPTRPAPVSEPRPVPRPPSAYNASRPDPRPAAYRGTVPKPRPAGDDQAASS